MASPHKTRPGNATKHPGMIGKTSTVVEFSTGESCCSSKEGNKDAKDAARTASIRYAAEFESTALDNEDLIDATPQPIFTPNANPHHTGKVPEMYSDSETQEITDEGEYVYPLPDSLSLRMSPQLPKGWFEKYALTSLKARAEASPNGCSKADCQGHSKADCQGHPKDCSQVNKKACHRQSHRKRT